MNSVMFPVNRAVEFHSHTPESALPMCDEEKSRISVMKVVSFFREPNK